MNTTPNVPQKPDLPHFREGPDPPVPRARNWRRWTAALILLAAVAASLFWGARHRAQEGYFGMRVFPAKAAYDFQLTDQNGQPFQLVTLRGKLVLFTFGFTHCPNFCPTSLTELAAVSRRLLPAQRSRVQILFVTVDPRRDTPEALRQYVPYFDPGIVGLTGSKAEIDRTVQAYGADYAIDHHPGNDPDVYSVNHTTYTYVVNPQGKVELIYDYDQLKQTDKIAADVGRVLDAPGN
ncbi:MAG TPA: SCO family protein [Chthoniobacterales bacterium]